MQYRWKIGLIITSDERKNSIITGSNCGIGKETAIYIGIGKDGYYNSHGCDRERARNTATHEKGGGVRKKQGGVAPAW
jgi:hypothetical protein